MLPPLDQGENIEGPECGNTELDPEGRTYSQGCPPVRHLWRRIPLRRASLMEPTRFDEITEQTATTIWVPRAVESGIGIGRCQAV